MTSSAAASSRWFRAGVSLIALSWVLFFVIQIVADDFLPPKISISQYGVGPHGWIFSVYLLATAAGMVCVECAMPTTLVNRVLVRVGALGTAVMALVPTDVGGLQVSGQAKVHMVGAVVGNSMVPLACCLMLVGARRGPRWVPISLASIVGVSLALLLVSATGVDTLGVGAATSWAYWQTVASVTEMVLFAVTAWRARPLSLPPPECRLDRAIGQ